MYVRMYLKHRLPNCVENLEVYQKIGIVKKLKKKLTYTIVKSISTKMSQSYEDFIFHGPQPPLPQ